MCFTKWSDLASWTARGRQIGPLAALEKLSGTRLRFAVDDDMTGAMVPATVLRHDSQPGLARAGTTGDRVDAIINFTSAGGNALPANSTVTWTGALVIEKAGSYWMYLQALGTNASLFIDEQRVGVTGTFQGDVHGDILQANQDNALPTRDGLDNVRHAVELAAGSHSIKIAISPDSSNSPVQLRLNWYTPDQRFSDHQAAIHAAEAAKVAVVFVWARRYPPFELPGEQNRLIEEVAAVNPNTIVVLNTSQPVALPWVDRVRGILEMWWPGDEGGWATAKLLLGKISPAGRLPVTWARRLEDYPASDPRHPERSAEGVDHRTTYSEGVNVGYRWFEHEHIEPLFAFGHGLSYTTFAYSGLTVAPTESGGLDVSVAIRNTGSQDADEVPQVYLSAPQEPPDGALFAPKTLVAFDRIRLKAGEAKRITLHVMPRQLQYWSIARREWATVRARRSVSVGPSSRDLRLEQSLD
jgi:beta-glucosidase